MERCPECNSILNIDEKASGRCFNCNATFEPEFNQENVETDIYKNFFGFINEEENVIAKYIKIVSIVLMILGTIGSGYIWYATGSFMAFMLSELSVVVGGLILMGFSEIIRLLEDIKRK